MKIQRIAIRNFRRLENVTIYLEDNETVFVGPNNSGKTSATAIIRCFLGGKEFKIHDFSIGKLEDIDAFGTGNHDKQLPAIELDIWLTIDPSKISFGRVFSLLPNLSDDCNTVGIRMKFEVNDPKKLLSDYRALYPDAEQIAPNHGLSQFLGIDQRLKKHFGIKYYALEITGQETTEDPLESTEGKSILTDLLRVDYVDAQRNIDDDEKSRSNKLSTAFATFYKRNLEQAEVAEEAQQVLDENNQKLTTHYAAHFRGLMKVIKNLGVPSVNDRDLRIVSSLSPETALQGNTELFYRDTARDHELPEAYNGLGFKNLIYMAIQISHYHLQWINTASNRPLCQLIFVEEPEVHLHAQVQQTFITNVQNIISEAAKATGQALIPQFVITTHSSHILDAVDFKNVRYFRRCKLEHEGPEKVKTLNASTVHNLGEFQPKPTKIDDRELQQKETLRFLRRYIRVTHCDLFFADAAILVEGAAEKLLLPKMIDVTAPSLRSSYLTVLEIGGAYAHLFSGLLEFLKIPYVIITDLDSVLPTGKHPACRGDKEGALTSNGTLKHYFPKKDVNDLLQLTQNQKEGPDHCIAFQTPVLVSHSKQQSDMTPRTFEEAFAYTNFTLITDKQLNLGLEIPTAPEDAYQAIYERIQTGKLKKTEFALNILTTTATWTTPEYITKGLQWLEKRLSIKTGPGVDEE